jgi:hypothetical protein
VFTGFLSLAGNELINNARVSAYAANLGITHVSCGDCSGLARALWDDPYSSPDMDDAPWFDPSVADSKGFAGLLGLDITGISKSTGYHDLVSLTTDGAALHPLRRTHREIQVKALALANSENALSYGFSWLASVLRGGVCAPGCAGDALCFFIACPPCPESMDSDVCATPYLRTLFNCGLLTMDEPSDVRKISGGWMGTVVFTIAAGDPHIYREPTLIVTSTQPGNQVINGYDPAVSVACDTLEDISCLVSQRPPVSTEWPACTPPPAPILPPIPIDSCFPVGKFTAARQVYTLPSGQVPIWAEKVPYLVIRAGSKRMERIIIRWYGNPTERDCTQTLDPCAACAEINIAFIPQGSTLTIDGRAETAFVDCPGGPGVDTAEPQIYGPGGSPFGWPVFNCADSLCLEVIAKYGTVSDDASIEIYYAIRQDAA